MSAGVAPSVIRSPAPSTVDGVRGEPEVIALNPQTLEPGEDAVVLRAVKALLEPHPQ